MISVDGEGDVQRKSQISTKMVSDVRFTTQRKGRGAVRSRGDREAHQRFKIQHFLKESVDKMGINTFLHSVDALSSLSLRPRAG